MVTGNAAVIPTTILEPLRKIDKSAVIKDMTDATPAK